MWLRAIFKLNPFWFIICFFSSSFDKTFGLFFSVKFNIRVIWELTGGWFRQGFLSQLGWFFIFWYKKLGVGRWLVGCSFEEFDMYFFWFLICIFHLLVKKIELCSVQYKLAGGWLGVTWHNFVVLDMFFLHLLVKKWV